jgi:hypothetical protein
MRIDIINSETVVLIDSCPTDSCQVPSHKSLMPFSLLLREDHHPIAIPEPKMARGPSRRHFLRFESRPSSLGEPLDDPITSESSPHVRRCPYNRDCFRYQRVLSEQQHNVPTPSQENTDNRQHTQVALYNYGDPSFRDQFFTGNANGDFILPPGEYPQTTSPSAPNVGDEPEELAGIEVSDDSSLDESDELGPAERVAEYQRHSLATDNHSQVTNNQQASDQEAVLSDTHFSNHSPASEQQQSLALQSQSRALPRSSGPESARSEQSRIEPSRPESSQIDSRSAMSTPVSSAPTMGPLQRQQISLGRAVVAPLRDPHARPRHLMVRYLQELEDWDREHPMPVTPFAPATWLPRRSGLWPEPGTSDLLGSRIGGPRATFHTYDDEAPMTGEFGPPVEDKNESNQTALQTNPPTPPTGPSDIDDLPSSSDSEEVEYISDNEDGDITLLRLLVGRTHGRVKAAFIRLLLDAQRQRRRDRLLAEHRRVQRQRRRQGSLADLSNRTMRVAQSHGRSRSWSGSMSCQPGTAGPCRAGSVNPDRQANNVSIQDRDSARAYDSRLRHSRLDGGPDGAHDRARQHQRQQPSLNVKPPRPARQPDGEVAIYRRIALTTFFLVGLGLVHVWSGTVVWLYSTLCLYFSPFCYHHS